MPNLKQGKRQSDWFIWEQDHDYAREVGVVTGGNYQTGTVLGRITTSGKYTQLKTGATNGSETPAAILLLKTDATSDVEATVIVRDAIVVTDQLTFPETIDAAGIVAAMTTLKELGIIEREEV